MTSNATANRTQVFRVKETTWGTTPATPSLDPYRMTGEGVDNNISTTTSKEIRADRMVADLIVVDSSPGGTVNFEMSYGSFDAELVAALMSTGWSTPLALIGIAGDITATTGTTTPITGTNVLSSTLVSKFTAVVAGQWIKLSGFTNPGDNGFFRVVTKTDNSHLIVSPAFGATETPAGVLAHVDGSYIRNGITEQSFTIIKVFNDATVVTRDTFTGMRVKQMTLALKTGSIATGQFTFAGKSAKWDNTPIAGEVQNAPGTNQVMNCVQNVLNILVNGAVLGSVVGSVMSLDFTLDNQHREQKGLGVLGNVGVVAGQLKITMKASQYFQDNVQALAFEAATAFSFSFQLTDGAGNTYIITLPRNKYESFTSDAGQLDSDVMAETSFTTILDPTTVCMIQIDKFAGP